MRVVGYVKEQAAPAHGGSVFAQSEQVRRWVSGRGYQLLATCQDVRGPDGLVQDSGYRALLEILSAGHADAVVIPSLEALSHDLVIQEIMLHDLRSRGVSVISAAEGDVGILDDPPSDAARLFIRDVLSRRDQLATALTEPSAAADLPEEEAGPRDIVVELVPARTA